MGVKQISKSLSVRESALADSFYQLNVLNGKTALAERKFTPFIEKSGLITPSGIDILQINIGKLCNQTCAHCHVDAGPDKKVENMDHTMVESCLALAKSWGIKTIDITGGAPEMNPHFRWLAEEATAAGIKVINRCNLTIIMSNPKYHDLPQFFADHKIHVVSSLPYFSKNRTDKQRGEGVFEDSIAALKMLNDVGYGLGNPDLKLDLVYNPSGAFLPGDQQSLENEFKSQLSRLYDIKFDQLYAITNLPISRFLDYLIESENYESYMEELVNAFNFGTVQGLMCRNTMSVSWDGYVYDCDFNQMLDIKSAVTSPHISTVDKSDFLNRNIVVNQHCYGCTAGAGSSCGGAVA